MICPHCQHEIADGLEVCSNCNLPIPAVVAPLPVEISTMPTDSSDITPPRDTLMDNPEEALPETVAAPLPVLKAPPEGLPGDRLFLSFSEKPDAIVRIMDEAVRKESTYAESNRKQLLLFSFLVPAGALFFILDWIVGGGLVSLALVGYACWAAALAGWLIFRRSRLFSPPQPPLGTAANASTGKSSILGRILSIIFFGAATIVCVIVPSLFVSIIFYEGQINTQAFMITIPVVIFVVLIALYLNLWKRRNRGHDFGPKFGVARGIFETLKDDCSPKRTFIGWLDLTGLEQPSKKFQEKTSQSGMPVGYYRDEWLNLKATLYDGSLLRLSAVERSKARLGRWKRSLSGKSKWKPGGLVQAREILRLVVVPNPSSHQLAAEIPAIRLESNVQIGNYYIESLQAQAGRLVCQAVSYKPVGAWDLLQVMKYAHSYVRPLMDATTAASV